MDNVAYRFLETQQFSHWWFRGRERVISAIMRRALSGEPGEKEILDIGSGYGALIPALNAFGAVDAMESHLPAHEALRTLGTRDIFGGSFPQECPDRHYNAVTLFDVIEHLDDDLGALTAVRERMLKDGGHLFLTVPAYQWLWSPHDDHNEHRRRYARPGLRRLLASAGFSDIRISYFLTVLFPLAVIQRVMQKMTGQTSFNEKPPHPIINNLLLLLFSTESLIVPHLTLPYGLSLIAHARKKP